MNDNLILVHAYLESGCSQEEGEVSVSWKPINFMIYSPLFQGMATDAADEWLDTFKMEPETHYEAVFKHVVERDGAGAVHSEYFVPVKLEDAA
jgi:hypothetical protein